MFGPPSHCSYPRLPAAACVLKGLINILTTLGSPALVLRVDSRGRHDDDRYVRRNAWITRHGRQELPSPHTGQLDIEQNQGYGARRQQSQCPLSTFHGNDVIATRQRLTATSLRMLASSSTMRIVGIRCIYTQHTGVSRPRWECERYGRSGPGPVVNPNAPAVRLNQRSTYRQPQSHAPGSFAVAFFVCLVERLEHADALFRQRCPIPRR